MGKYCNAHFKIMEKKKEKEKEAIKENTVIETQGNVNNEYIHKHLY